MPENDPLNLDAAWTAHLVRLSARIDALAALVLKLAYLHKLDPAKLEAELHSEEKRIADSRLAKMADSNMSGASKSAAFLKEWTDSTLGQGGPK